MFAGASTRPRHRRISLCMIAEITMHLRTLAKPSWLLLSGGGDTPEKPSLARAATITPFGPLGVMRAGPCYPDGGPNSTMQVPLIRLSVAAIDHTVII
jgi:hypothetical protein